MISVVIPTLQKREKILIKLLDSLFSDKSVDEVIVIDNSLKGINYKNSKLRVIIPEKNLFVNPSWNLGVKEAKNEIVALLNDDIMICENFCSDVVSKFHPGIGMVGMDENFVINDPNLNELPKKTGLSLKEASYRSFCFGIAIFLYKSSYFEIPDEIKINYGDDWLFVKNKKAKRRNYLITGQKIHHLCSLSAGEKSFNPICRKDGKIFKKLTVKWYNRLFSFEEVDKFHKLRLLGITFKFRKKSGV